MTPTSRTQRFGAPLLAAGLTALVFTGGLWWQHSRSAWPFAVTQAAVVDDDPHAGHAGLESESAYVERVALDAASIAALDVRLETVTLEPLAETVRAVATIAPDESRISHVHTRVAGWLEQLDVTTTGEVVRAGQPVARIFSQELLSSQTEYLAAIRNTSALGITSAVVASGRSRLRVLGMSDAEIDAIERTGEPRRLVTVVAPRSGVVVNRGVSAGTAVDPSTTLLTILDLSRVWIVAEVPEGSIAAMRVGSRAQLDFPASGLAPFAARVEFVSPVLTERTRTLRVRLSAANPGGVLKPGLFGTATFETAGRHAITIPRDAVVDTGRQQHVFVASAGQYEPRLVRLGTLMADRVEVREGLDVGEQIVAAGVFLLDSESRLRATGGTGGHQHGTPPAAAPPPPVDDPHAAHRTPPEDDPHAGHED